MYLLRLNSLYTYLSVLVDTIVNMNRSWHDQWFSLEEIRDRPIEACEEKTLNGAGTLKISFPELKVSTKVFFFLSTKFMTQVPTDIV